jgi:hypothetical protein
VRLTIKLTREGPDVMLTGAAEGEHTTGAENMHGPSSPFSDLLDRRDLTSLAPDLGGRREAQR